MKKLLAIVSVLLFATSLLAEQTVTGRVLDTEGEPMIGVSIQVKGTSTGTLTNLDGDFVLDVPDASAVLVFSYVGYQTQ